MFAEQLGKRLTEADLDSSLQSIGLDAADLDELRILIEEDFKLSISVIEEEHREIDVNSLEHNLKELTLRQLAGWINDWINRDEVQPPFHGRHTRET
jgi:hypothetical protein